MNRRARAWIFLPVFLFPLYSMQNLRGDDPVRERYLYGEGVKFWDLNRYYGWAFTREHHLQEYTRDSLGKRSDFDYGDVTGVDYTWSLKGDSLFYGPSPSPKLYKLKIITLRTDSLVFREEDGRIRCFLPSPYQTGTLNDSH